MFQDLLLEIFFFAKEASRPVTGRTDGHLSQAGFCGIESRTLNVLSSECAWQSSCLQWRGHRYGRQAGCGDVCSGPTLSGRSPLSSYIFQRICYLPALWLDFLHAGLQFMQLVQHSLAAMYWHHLVCTTWCSLNHTPILTPTRFGFH